MHTVICNYAVRMHNCGSVYAMSIDTYITAQRPIGKKFLSFYNTIAESWSYANEWRALYNKSTRCVVAAQSCCVIISVSSAEMLQSYLAAILVVGIFTGKGDLLLVDVSYENNALLCLEFLC